jgi:glycosyltransferase involved in cell wall biosynthesis
MPRVSIVMPAYREGENVRPVLDRIFENVMIPCEALVVVDSPDDDTVPVVAEYAAADPRVRHLVNTHGPGPANAIRFGIENARSPVVVVTMADGSDDPGQIDDLTRLVERGVVVAAASRYSSGGQQVGAPWLKHLMSSTAGRSLWWLARVGTRDATNSFKAYSTEFVEKVRIDSRDGFEIGLELTAKARRLRQPVAELPTIWIERREVTSNFKLVRWLPSYLRWYLFAFGPRLDLDTMRRQLDASHELHDGSAQGDAGRDDDQPDDDQPEDDHRHVEASSS